MHTHMHQLGLCSQFWCQQEKHWIRRVKKGNISTKEERRELLVQRWMLTLKDSQRPVPSAPALSSHPPVKLKETVAK